MFDKANSEYGDSGTLNHSPSMTLQEIRFKKGMSQDWMTVGGFRRKCQTSEL